MNWDRKILVIGATGAVGRSVVAALNQLGYQVSGAGRRPCAELADYHQIDLFDEKALTELCQPFSLIINAAGPASQIQDRIARAALASATDYLDVAGEPVVWQQLAADEKLAPLLQKSACILGAGYVPGFASILPFLAANRLKTMGKVRSYLGGIEPFTVTSAIDFIDSLNEQNGKAGHILSGGALQRAAIEKNVQPETANRAFDALPYLSFELERVARQLNLVDFAAFNLLADRQLLLTDQFNGEQGIKQLISQSEELTHHYGQQQHILLEAEGVLVGQPVTLIARGRFTDSYRFTGIVAALAADMMLKTPQSGLKWLSDLADAEQLLSGLEHMGAFEYWQIEIKQRQSADYVEGEL
ncbi:NAD-dependent epimerase/dehydratase family protein [Photorhabdus khanii]|uniref:Saccharopine dehydrogenase n=1 Tax=Photorhabdus khanii subsp. guanajuatensis TaxID=2100166 RepID=A0A4R4JZ82_9GAMM|nr:NAD-dependent epimerase/dehydratase family protein [Photorhabdus khanii]TDB59446.1 saccharopine dehydrogenase [Photorhabdus khanii subsp. guanajuatensis]